MTYSPARGGSGEANRHELDNRQYSPHAGGETISQEAATLTHGNPLPLAR